MTIYFSISKDAEILANPLTLSKKFARIAYEQYATSANSAASEDGYNASNIIDPATYNKFKSKFDAANISIGFDDDLEIDCVSINGLIAGTTVNIGYYTTSSFVQVMNQLVDESGVAIFNFVSVITDNMLIDLTNNSVKPEAVNITVGNLLVMPHSIYGGHSPLNLSRQTAIRPVISEGGQLLGRSIIKKGFSTGYSWSNLDPEWYRQYFDPFVKSARTVPFFIAWKPSDYPSETGYVWTNNDITPQNTGTADFMSVGIQVVGVDNGS